MRMRNAAIVLAAGLMAVGGLLSAGLAPVWLANWTGISPGSLAVLGLAIAGIGLFGLGRRRSRVRFVMD